MAVRPVSLLETLGKPTRYTYYVGYIIVHSSTILTAFTDLILASAAIVAGRSKVTARAIENRRVRALVKEALETLQAKEAANYIDPVQTPLPSVASLQLRDLVMQDEHSTPVRVRVWEQVERVVEGNANVRTNMEVMSSGDEGRVWTWIGNAGVAARRLQLAEGQTAASGRPVV